VEVEYSALHCTDRYEERSIDEGEVLEGENPFSHKRTATAAAATDQRYLLSTLPSALCSLFLRLCTC
jgi:hypothetical protein